MNTEIMKNCDFNRVLVANRGEIALRIFRACRSLGIETVAVFSDADSEAPHTLAADFAVNIGPAPSGESYLVIDKIIDGAKRSGAQAIHPGYGFLAENGELALACEEAGLVFIGPPVEAIRSMGSKREAKKIVAEVGVPVIPGYDGSSQEPEILAQEALKIGFPVLIKASAGGGGKGMRTVYSEDELEAAINAAKREAISGFGDGTLLIEKYIESPRHVEFQILGDRHGNLVHLFERECSIQRRHQKIIEETPSTALDSTLRQSMGEAAIEVGRAIGYYNAGTVEFIVSPEGDFYFLEVNTRLQVEHPITELVTGIDLVQEQIRIARGESLHFQQDEITQQGAAVECRLYAESPSNDFLPATGTVLDWRIPDIDDLRIDSGIEIGSKVGIHYDPLLAKLITFGVNRREATDKMRLAIRQLSILGLTTNRAFLQEVLSHSEYRSGDIDTHFVQKHMAAALDAELDDSSKRQALIIATLAGHRQRQATSPAPGIVSGYRNNRGADQWSEFEIGDETTRVSYRDLGRGRFSIAIGEWNGEIRAIDWSGAEVTIEDEQGVRHRASVAVDGTDTYVHLADVDIKLFERPTFSDSGGDQLAGGYKAVMPGKILQLHVVEGDEVSEGDTLVIMEAMKMEQTIVALSDGVVTQVLVSEGEIVGADVPLLVIETAEG